MRVELAGMGLRATVASLALMGVVAGRCEAMDRTAVTTTAPQAAQGEGGTATLKVYSREVVVDVQVVDAQGQPVRSLTQADFTVKENGKEQGVRSFAEFNGGVVTAGRVPELVEGLYRNYQNGPVSGPVNILLLDSLNVPQGMVAYARRETVKYLQTMPEGTQVAMFSLSHDGLHLLQGFTTDRRLLIGAVSRALGGGGGLEKWTRDWITTDALEEIATYVSGVEGRKNLLWFTPSMPVMLLRDGGYSGGNPLMGQVHRLMDAYELLSKAQVAIDPVSPAGVGPQMGMSTLLMEEVAEESGGHAYYNSNDLASLIGRAVDNGSSYYTLSYVPAAKKDDGRYHHISVEVNRPGVHLVYRKGYNAEDPLSPKAIAPGKGLLEAVTKGRAMTGTEMPFDLQVEQSATEDSGKESVAQQIGNGRRRLATPNSEASVTYKLAYTVPVEQIVFAVGANGTHTASLEFDAVVYGKNGRLATAASKRVRIVVPAEKYDEFMKTPFQFTQLLALPAGETMVRAGILDDATKKAGEMEVPVTVRLPVAEK